MEKHYCILRIEKVKTRRDLRRRFNHNERIVNISNVDPSKTKDNVHYIDNFGRSYESLLQNELTRLIILGVPEKTLRKDAVLGIEVYMGFSHDALGSFDLDKWARASLEWLDNTYNPPNHEIRFISEHTGEEQVEKVQNIKHFVLHMDENVPHIHAFIVPINDHGYLCAKYYHEKTYPFYRIQNSYAEQMKEFGLSRGEKYSAARHEDVKEYYNKLEMAVTAELPEPDPGENVYDYYKRANHEFQVEKVHHRDEIVKKDQEIVQVKSEAVIKVEEILKKTQTARDVTEIISRRLDLNVPVTQDIAEDVVRSHLSLKSFKKGIEKHPDREQAERAQELYNAMVNWTMMQELDMQIEERGEK